MPKVQVKGSYPECKNDGFPMLKINGKLQCVAEYLNYHIGERKVVDLIRHDKTTYYVFETGHKLPMLCFCCGNPVVYEDIEKSRREMCGRRLESMSVRHVTLESGKNTVEFILEFFKKDSSSPQVDTTVAPEVALFLEHPVNRARRKQRIAVKRKLKKKRKRKR